MSTAIVVTKSEVRKIIAEHFNVPIEDVWPSKYSFTVIQEDGKELSSWSETQKVVQETGTKSASQIVLKYTCLNGCGL